MTLKEREDYAKSKAFDDIVVKAFRKYEKERQAIMDESKDIFVSVLKHFADGKYHTAKEMANWTKGSDFPLNSKEIAQNILAMSYSHSRYMVNVRKTTRYKKNTWCLLDDNGNPTNVTMEMKGSIEYCILEVR